MDQSWRLRPPNQGNGICPICSFPHFPFCPPTGFPAMGRNPLHLPFPDPGMPSQPAHSNVFLPHPSAHQWQKPRPPMLNLHPSPPRYDYANGGGFSREEFHDSERIHKRARLDDMGMAALRQIQPHFGSDQGRFLYEDERRLNLVRDHGGYAVAQANFRDDLGFVHEEEWRMWKNAALNSYDRPGFGSIDVPFPPPDPVYSFHGAHNSSVQDEFNRGRWEVSPGPIRRDTLYSSLEAPLHPSSGYHDPPGHVPQAPHGSYRTPPSGSSLLFPSQKPESFDEDRFLARSVVEHLHRPHGEVAPKGLRLPVDQPSMGNHRGYLTSAAQGDGSLVQPFDARAPLPPLPPNPYPADPPRPLSVSHLQAASSSAPVSSSAAVHFPGSPVPEALPVPPSVQGFIYSNSPGHALAQFPAEGLQVCHHLPPKKYPDVGQALSAKPRTTDKIKIVDAALLFKKPHRATRPDHIVVILRGLPGSGKSYLAKFLRDLEVENGGKAPRIHSMDDYFMTEVEKVEEIEASKSSSNLGKGTKRITKKVTEYCYEPEMEEAYRSSMLKSFKKTLEEGVFNFVIVDDRNLRVADFAQFWATGKMSGYEVYLLEATYKDPVGCAARNVHGFTTEDIKKMAEQWEPAPSLYLQLDIQSLFHGDDLNGQSIQEVDMDMDMDMDMDLEEDTCSEGPSSLQDKEAEKRVDQPFKIDVPDGQAGERWKDEVDEPPAEVKELGKSKWSEDLDGYVEKEDNSIGHSNALSGLAHVYKHGAKSVHWGDQVGKRGFSISALKKFNISLIIGPGAGYNLAANPLPEEEKANAMGRRNTDEPQRAAFLEQLKAERESFRAVFDRRRHRIGGLDIEDD